MMRQLKSILKFNSIEFKIYNKITYPDIDAFSYEYVTEIWKEKQELIDDIHDQLIKRGGASLMLNTGKGKTVILTNLIWKLGLSRVIIFVPNKTLQRQMLKDSMKHLNLNRSQVKLIGGLATKDDKAMIEIPPLTICVARSGTNMLDKDWLCFNNYSFAVFDEAHTFCSDKNRELLYATTTKYKLALSASIDEPWNNRIIFDSCGALINGDEYIPDPDFETNVEIIKYYGPPEYTRIIHNEKTGMVSYSETIDMLADDHYRNYMILDLIDERLKQGTNMFVFGYTKKMIDVLYDMFNEYCSTSIAGKITGDVPFEERDKVMRDANVIFITYSTGSIGLNIPRFTEILFASPFVKNGKQISGRTLRMGFNNRLARYYFDIVDMRTTLKHQMRKRIEGAWALRGATITHKEVYYDEK